jgi:hypothetical protein
LPDFCPIFVVHFSSVECRPVQHSPLNKGFHENAPSNYLRRRRESKTGTHSLAPYAYCVCRLRETHLPDSCPIRLAVSQ